MKYFLVFLLIARLATGYLTFASVSVDKFRKSLRNPTFNSALVNDVGTSFVALGGSFAWLQFWIGLAKSGKIDPKVKSYNHSNFW